MRSNLERRALFAQEDQIRLREYFAAVYRTEAIQRRRADIREQSAEQIDRYATTAKLHFSGCCYVE